METIIILAIISAVGIPAVGASIGLIKYFWRKSQCFELLKARVENQQKSINEEKKEHQDIHTQLIKMEKSLSNIAGHIGIAEK
jgi:type II secretory pathway pseudopilin PulG